jgi:class 3 adenylate cyclase
MDAGRALPEAWRFAGFTLNLVRGTLLADGETEVALRPKSFALLRLLVENAGRLLDRDTIMSAIWPDVVVGDEAITHCIRDIRRVLGDEAQLVVKTVPKRGYVFAAEVSLAEPITPVQRAVRRLAAVLAADVVGYSRLMGWDEPGTLARLKRHREELMAPLVARHGGRIVNHPGDSVLCEFASVVEAVACAVAIQEGMAGREAELPEAERVRFRIGVNLGDVIVEGGEIYGDGVNVAARLEGVAEPGGVCVSGQVRDAVLGKLELGFEDLGEPALKNIARPVHAWRVAIATAVSQVHVGGDAGLLAAGRGAARARRRLCEHGAGARP